MADGSKHIGLLESILACRRRVVVMRGPAQSGKTSAVLGLYEHGIGGQARPGCLLLAPNRQAVQWLRRQLLARSGPGILVSPRIMTFAHLAGQVLLAGRLPHRLISPIHRWAVLTGIIADLAGRGRLKVLTRVADTPGLVTAVDRSIAELKRAAVEPAELAGALSAGDGKHHDLLAIYQAYQDYLTRQQLYDEEGRMWQAREQLVGMDRPPLPHLTAVAADGFTDFTPTQLSILAQLSRHVDRLVITLPHAAEDGRGKLWRWTTRQLRRIEQTFGEDLDVVQAAPPDTAGQAEMVTEGMCRRVFSLTCEPMCWPAGLELLAAAGMESECLAIARWAKRHLKAGVEADELLVVARDIDAYRPTLRRVFANAGLVPPAAAVALSQTAPGRLLLAAVRLAGGYCWSDVLAVVSNSYFRPESLGDFAPGSPAVAQLVIRQGNVVEGRSSYARAAGRLADRLGRLAGRDELEEFTSPLERYLCRLGPAAVEDAGRLIEALFDLVDPIASGGTIGQLASACRALLTPLGLVGSPSHGRDDESSAAQMRALAAVDGVLGELALLRGLPGTDRPLSASRFAEVLAAVLADTPSPPASPAASIPTAGALDARGVRARHVWLAGLNEGVFPARPAEKALIGEGDRRRWRQKGLSLDVRDDLTAREMLLFYLTASRANQTLTLSWLHSDSSGRAMARSGFVDALLGPAGGVGGRVEVLPPGEFAPPPERIVSRAELLNTALAAAGARPSGAGSRPQQSALELARHVDGASLRRIAGPLWAAHRRWHLGSCDAYDGILNDPQLLAHLKRLVPAEMLLSVSQVDQYLSCPWQYFAERWLKLVELAEPADAVLPRQRGVLAHAVLRRLATALGEGRPVARSALALPEAMAALDDAIAAEAATVAVAAGPQAALWENELRRLRQAVAGYLSRQGGQAPPGEIRYVELAFGMAPSPGADPASTPAPLVLAGPAGDVRLRGKIDRVDVLCRPDGPTEVFVIDYKTGAVPSVTSDVQLPVYIKAAERITGLSAAGGAFHAVSSSGAKDSMFARFKLSRGKLKENESYAEQLDDALARVHQAVANIAAGRFPVFGQVRCRGASCPFRRICRYSNSRAAFKGSDQETGDD